MDVVYEEEAREAAVMDVARKMMIAARTAPKAKGTDLLVTAVLKKEAIKQISDKLKEMVQRDKLPDFFLRDAVNLLSADALVVFGTKIQAMGLNPCGMCGLSGCAEKAKHPNHPCVLNTGDLGIAIGSAASVAMDHRVDNRIMYTVGQALLEMQVFGEEVKIIYGIPLSVSGKNPFFDRDKDKLIEQA